MYEDSGIWSEDQIVKSYIDESIKRKDEILKLINDKLSDTNVLGRTLENTIYIRWRTKYIFIKWSEKMNIETRYIISIDIR